VDLFFEIGDFGDIGDFGESEDFGEIGDFGESGDFGETTGVCFETDDVSFGGTGGGIDVS